jgi:hypothetical protein
MITRTSRSEWQRRAIIAETRVAELLRELADTITAVAADAGRQEAAIAGALETARHQIVKGLKTALGCDHAQRPSCKRCQTLGKAIFVVDAAVAAAGGTAPAEDETA